uniref:G-protein coupled receptors family 1 profile domain-containing protein n=1 Tax=Ditylenchus dipsaci TaxID=166011 RepID=A0A915E1S9_9BILA
MNELLAGVNCEAIAGTSTNATINSTNCSFNATSNYSSQMENMNVQSMQEEPSSWSVTAQEEEFLSSLSLFFTFLMVLMCLAGAIMNSLSLAIFTGPAFRRRSINVLLAGLSASDLCLCLLALPVFSLNQLNKVLPISSHLLTSRLLIYAYPITLMAQTMSVWMLVSITVDRYLAVCYPFAVRIYCTRTRALLTILTIVIFSIGYNFVRFWEYTINDEPGIPDEARIVGLLRENHYYMLLYQNIAMLVTQFVLPLLVLGLLNLQVAKAILEADETRRVLVASEKREHVTAKMMLFIVIVFIFCYVLSFCLNLLEVFNPELFKNPVGFLLNDVNNVLVVLNSSSSFIFYTKYSSRYRAQLKRMRYGWLRLSWWLFFCCCCIGEPEDYHYDANGQRQRGKQPGIKSYSEVSAINFSTSENYGAATLAAAKQMLQYNLNNNPSKRMEIRHPPKIHPLLASPCYNLILTILTGEAEVCLLKICAQGQVLPHPRNWKTGLVRAIYVATKGFWVLL